MVSLKGQSTFMMQSFPFFFFSNLLSCRRNLVIAHYGFKQKVPFNASHYSKSMKIEHKDRAKMFYCLFKISCYNFGAIALVYTAHSPAESIQPSILTDPDFFFFFLLGQ